MPIISPRARLLSATALACGSISIGTTAARAACAPDPPGGSPVVKCAGVDDNGFAAPPADDLTVDVTGTVQGNAADLLRRQQRQEGPRKHRQHQRQHHRPRQHRQRHDHASAATSTAASRSPAAARPTSRSGRDRNFNGRVSLQGGANKIDSSGTFNKGLVLAATDFNDVFNRAGAQINQIFSLSGDGENRLENSGTVNNGLTIDGDGIGVVFNRANATINGDLSSVGTSKDYVDNYGLFNNRIMQGDGIDVTINQPGGKINGQVSQGGARDGFQMLGGLLNQDVQQGDGADYTWIHGGLINGGVATGAGEDQLLWDGGNIKGFGIDMGGDDDVAIFRGLTSRQPDARPEDPRRPRRRRALLAGHHRRGRRPLPAVGDLRSCERLGTDLRRHPDNGRYRHRRRRAPHRPDQHGSRRGPGRGRAGSGAKRRPRRRHLERRHHRSHQRPRPAGGFAAHPRPLLRRRRQR